MLDGLLAPLRAMACYLSHLADYVAKGVIVVVNYVIVGVAATVTALLDLFPPMPDLPDWDGGSLSVQLLNWLLPMGSYIALWAVIIEIVLVIFAVRVAARWVKLL